ncbi:MAG: hypothetical protein O7A98_07775 [Acidobacteria bacterium]|nr:hypothetical protein [Acidobacteriota bacterium]
MRVSAWQIAGLAGFFCLLGVVESARATEVRFFRQRSREDFLVGELEGLAIDADGALRRAAHFERFAEIEEPFVFVAAVDSDGWVLGTGNSGRVLQVASDGEVSTLWTAPEPEIFALWIDDDGTVFAGSSPNGKVYVLKEGEAREVFDPAETYIWAIARSPWGDLLVATGDGARLYEVAADGESRLLFESDEVHLRSLHPLADSVLIGTAGDGLIHSINAEGRVRTWFDAEQTEVIAFADDGLGGWYAAAVSSEASFTQQAGQSSTTNGDENGAMNGVTVSVEVSMPASKASSSGTQSAILRSVDGEVRSVASLDRETVYALAWIDGRLWIGSGVEGNVYSLVDGHLALEAGLDDRQVIGLFAGEGPVLATTNGAALHRPVASPEKVGTYVSQALDAGAVARFGSLRWRGSTAQDGAVRFAVRSGIGSTPDATWSDWSPATSGWEIALAKVPRGRFVQWRLELDATAGDEARVTSVEVSYRQNNAEPRIEKFGAMDPGQVLVPSAFNAGDQIYEPAHPNREGIFTRLDAVSPGNGGRLKTLWRHGFMTLRWEAADPNEDELAFALSFRRDDSASGWLPMETDLDETHYSFDATVLPDGVYRFRLEASDRPGNTGETALVANQISEPIVIDHSPPALGEVLRRDGRATVTLVDALSPIRSAELSVDVGEWKPVPPLDGLLDGRREILEVDLPGDAEMVLLRVMDAAFNSATFDLLEKRR